MESIIGSQYSITKSPSLCSRYKILIGTQRHCNVHCLVPEMINNPNFTVHTHTQMFSFLFCLVLCTCITHVSFEALKSGFQVFLVNDATSHGVRKSQLVPSNSQVTVLGPILWNLVISNFDPSVDHIILCRWHHSLPPHKEGRLQSSWLNSTPRQHIIFWNKLHSTSLRLHLKLLSRKSSNYQCQKKTQQL